MDLINYPVQYILPVQLKDGTLIQLRPIHPTDGDQAAQFKASLSTESIYARFHGYIPPINEQTIRRLTVIDYQHEMAIVAEVMDGIHKKVIAVARIAAENDQKAEMAIIIADQWQGKGLGSILSNYLIKIGRDMGFEELYATVLAQNTQMLEILRHEGFTFGSGEDNRSVLASLKLN